LRQGLDRIRGRGRYALTCHKSGHDLQHALRRDNGLPDPERAARATTRIGAVVGAAAGSAAGIAAVSVPGLGAARISSGLDAIGAAATGGGMAVGAACVIAAPAAAAAIVGYLIYRIALWPASRCRQPRAVSRSVP
jgi:hypothetical protein